MARIYVMRGLPASGKSTRAKEIAAQEDAVIVSRDEIRRTMFGRYGKFSPAQEKLVTGVEETMVREAVSAGRNVVVDAMHLRAKYARKWFEFSNDVEFVRVGEWLTLPQLVELDYIRRRTGKSVGEAVIRDLWKRFTTNGVLNDDPKPPSKPLVYDFPRIVQNPDLPRAIIVDIDGTLAGHDGTNPRGHHDYHLVGNDYIHQDIDNLLFILEQGYPSWLEPDVRRILVSGRPDSCRDETVEWLDRHGWGEGNYDLFMRATGDMRRDDVVKYEIFRDNIQDKYHVDYVFDDRDRVVKMWRALGLRTLQVADGDF